MNVHAFSGYNVPAPPGGTLYGALAGASTTSDLYTIDPSTGAATSVGPIGFAVTGLAFRPSDNVLFGVTSGNSAISTRSLITIDTITGDGTLVGGLFITQGLADISFRSDDVLYGFSGNNSRLYTVNTSTGTATQVSATAVPPPLGFGLGLSFDSADILYVFPRSANGVFYIVDETTVSFTAQTALSGTAYPSNASIPAASFDAADLCWVVVNDASVPQWEIATVDVATSTITSIGVTTSTMDALAWGP